MDNKELHTILEQAEDESTRGNYAKVEQLCHRVLAEMSVSVPAEADSKAIHSHALRLFSESLWRRGRTSESLGFAEDALQSAEQAGLTEEQAWALGNYGNLYWYLSEYPTALEYYFKAVSLFENARHTGGMAKYYGNIGTVYSGMGDFLQALEFYQKALALYQDRGQKDGVAVNLGNIGLVYKRMADYTPALEYFRKALALYEELGIQEGVARNLCNIAIVYRNLSDFPRALEYFQKALKIDRILDSKDGIARNLGNIGNVYFSLQDLTQTLEYYHQALEINRELGLKNGIATNLSNIGNVYTLQGKYADALETYQTALEINQMLGRLGSVAGIKSNIGALYATKEYEGYNPDRAEQYLLEAISINEKLGTKQNLYESYRTLADLYREKNEWEKFALYFEKYHLAEKEVQNEQSKKVSERFDYERKIAAEHARLEERERVVEELKALNSSLREAHREKNEMLGIVAHDLKNPLTGILISAESMKRFLSQLTPNDLEKRLSNIITAAEHMKDIIMKLLDIQLLESGRHRLDVEPIDLGKHLLMSITRHNEQAKAKNIRLLHTDYSRPIYSIADSKAIEDIFDNILSNAIKFSPFGSPITVTITATPSGTVQIRVRDQGPGLSPDDLTKLFSKFMPLSAKPTGGEHSTGLGLSIVKKLVEAMNGTVWCESTAGNGATFIVEFKEYI